MVVESVLVWRLRLDSGGGVLLSVGFEFVV